MQIKTSKALSFLVPAILLAGATAAQTASDGGRKLETSLTGAAEVPGPGDPDGSGTAKLTLNPGQGRVCFELSVRNVDNITAGHIHEAAPTAAGPIVVGLFMGALDEDGCVNADRALIKEIMKDPADYYVNIHSTAHPAGAVRGQLSK